MKPSPFNKIILLVSVASLLVVITAAFGLLMEDSFDKQVRFELIDHHGVQQSTDDFAGKYLLALFGFTHCPQVCPTQMLKVSAIVNLLDGHISQEPLIPIFISVDPERDTVARIRDYVSRFHPAFVGLTGQRFQLARASRSFRSSLLPPPDARSGNYDVPHPAVLYLVGPDGRMLTHIPFEAGTAESVARIREAVL